MTQEWCSHSQQYMQNYQHWQQPSQRYGRYGSYYQDNVFSVNAWKAFQFQDPNELQTVFTSEMRRSAVNAQRNAIQSEDLSNILNNCQGIKSFFNNIYWSREMCSIMIAMLDRSGDGFMQWEEFLELQQCLVAWFNCFKQYDHDGSGFIESNELIGVITHLFGYQVSKECLTTILKRYSRVLGDRHGQPICLIAFDDFVSLSVRLRAYTDAFRRRDAAAHGGETGYTQFHYDDFLQCVLCL